MLCEYKDIFGEPGEGVHSYRIFGMAAFDLILTFFAAILLSKKTGQNLLLIFEGLILLSIIVHLIFCVDTSLVKFLTPES